MRERVVSRGGAGKGGHCPMGQCRLAGWPHDRFPPPGSGPSMRRTMRPGRLAHLLLGTPRPLLPSSAQRSRNHLEASSRPETAAGGQGLGVGALLASFRRDPSPQAAHRVAWGTAPAASVPRRVQERAPACVPLACPLPALSGGGGGSEAAPPLRDNVGRIQLLAHHSCPQGGAGWALGRPGQEPGGQQALPPRGCRARGRASRWLQRSPEWPRGRGKAWMEEWR